MLSIFNPNVHVGLNAQLAEDKRHGIVWVRGEDGGMVVQPFMVDRPTALVNPSWLTIRSMFRQVARMGFYPIHLEIRINKKATVYKNNSYRPVYSQVM